MAAEEKAAKKHPKGGAKRGRNIGESGPDVPPLGQEVLVVRGRGDNRIYQILWSTIAAKEVTNQVDKNRINAIMDEHERAVVGIDNAWRVTRRNGDTAG